MAGIEVDAREDQDRHLIQPQLWAGLQTLRRLVACHQSGEPFPNNWNIIDGNICGKPDSHRPSSQTSLLPQGSETTQNTFETRSDEAMAESELKTIVSTSDGAKRMDGLTGNSLPPTQTPAAHDEARLTSVSPPSTPVSARSQDPTCRARIQASDSGLLHCPSQGDLPSAASESKGEKVLQGAWQQERKPISAADLEAAAVEGRRLALVAATTCKALGDKEAAMSRSVQNVWVAKKDTVRGEAFSSDVYPLDPRREALHQRTP